MTPTALEVEVLIGVLSAVTFILLFMFLMILVYSRRQKFLQSPASRGSGPFPVQINMKELLTASPLLSGETSSHSPNLLTMGHAPGSSDYDQFMIQDQRTFEECRSKWHSTGHVASTSKADFGRPPLFRSSLQSGPTITANPLCSEYASVDIQNIGHYRSIGNYYIL